MMQTEKERDLIYKLLYQALLEIREESYQTGNNKIHALSNLFHNIPLMLRKASEPHEFEIILEKLKTKSEELHIRKWLDNAVSQV